MSWMPLAFLFTGHPWLALFSAGAESKPQNLHGKWSQLRQGYFEDGAGRAWCSLCNSACLPGHDHMKIPQP